MTPPRHLWSGDWRRESAAAAEELARRKAATDEPSATPQPAPSNPSAPAGAHGTAGTRARAIALAFARAGARALALARAGIRVLALAVARAGARVRALARTRSLPRRRTVLTAMAMLLTAAVAFAAVSALRSGGGGPAPTRSASVASSPARRTAPAWLGVEAIQFPLANGVMVVDVVPGSPAAAAGIEPGEVITQVGNQPVQTPTELEAALARMHPGQQVEIQYELGQSSYTTRVTLAARPANAP